MNQADNPEHEYAEPGDRLSRLSKASLRITETLDVKGGGKVDHLDGLTA